MNITERVGDDQYITNVSVGKNAFKGESYGINYL